MSRRLLPIIASFGLGSGCASSPRTETTRLPEGGYIALAHHGTNPVIDTTEQPTVRVGLAADRAAFVLVHHFLGKGALPPAEVVRVEDMLTALAPAPAPPKTAPLSLGLTIAPTPFRDGWHALVIAIATRDGEHGPAPTLVSDSPRGALEQALGERGAPIVGGGIAQLVAALDNAERLIFVGDGAGLGGVDAQSPMLQSVASFRARGGVLSVVARLGPGMDDALLDRLALVGGGTHDVVMPGEERHLAARLMRGPGLTNALADVRFDPAVVARWRLIGYESRTTRPPSQPAVGGFIPAGEGLYLAFEVKLSRPSGVLASATSLGSLRVSAVETNLSLALVPSDDALDAHRAVVTIAAFAEKLRGSYFGKDLAWELISGQASALATPALRDELADLIERARALWSTAPGIERPAYVLRGLP